MLKPQSEPWIWRVALTLCVLAAVLLGALAVVAPADLAIARVLLAVCVLALVVVGGFAFAQVRGRGVHHQARRWASLLVGGLGGAVVVALVPSIGEFARPLGSGTAIVVQAAFGLLGLGIAAIGVGGFARREPGRD